jgi:hypothetical protein
VLTTADAGTTWTKDAVPAGIKAVRGISCPSSKLCYVVGDTVSGGVVLETADSATSWTTHTLTPGIWTFSGIACSSTSRCYAAGGTYGGGQTAGGTATRSGGVILTTTDGGIFWTKQSVPHGLSQVYDVTCPSDTRCYALTLPLSGAGDDVLTTGNAGVTWSVLSLPVLDGSGSYTLDGIACPSATRCYMITTRVILVTANSGTSWTPVATLPRTTTTHGRTDTFKDIACPSLTQCFAVGTDYHFGGVVLSTDDGGTVWTTQNVPSGAHPTYRSLNSIACPSTSECIALGNNGSQGYSDVTFDGGATWSGPISAAPTTPPELQDITCPSVTECYAIGTNRMWMTGNAATTWAPQTLPAGAALADMACPSINSCIAVGSGSGSLASGSGSGWVGGIIVANTNPSPPAITTLAPDSGTTTGGTKVTITGTQLTGASKVLFGTATAASFKVTSPTTVTATTAANAAGKVSVSVETTHGTVTKASAFTFVPPPPSVTSLTPTTGTTTGGTKVTITGNHLTGASKVLFGTVPSTTVHVTDSIKLTAKTPAHAAGSVTVEVTAVGGSGFKASAFTYMSKPTSLPVTTTVPRSGGYDMVGSDGGVFVFSPPGTTGGFFGSLPGLEVEVSDVVGMVPTDSDQGYFLVGSDGGVFAFGNAPFLGSLPGLGVNPTQPITGLVPTGTDGGYFLVGKDGGVFAFGNAQYLGSLPGIGVHRDDITGIAATPSGNGYWLVAADGTVYGFGAAQTLGSATSTSSPVMAIAGTPDGDGYWIVTQNGSVHAFGDAKSFGTLPALGVSAAFPIIGIVHTAGTGGYWLIGADGGIFAFGDAGFVGSLPGVGVHVTDVVGAVPTAG